MNRRKFLQEAIATTTALVVGEGVIKEVERFTPKKLQAIALITDVPNGNKRIYTRATIERCIEVFNSNNRNMLGELGTSATATISLERTSHLVTNMKLNAENFIVDIELLDTEKGRILGEMLANDTVVFRTRGVGGVVDNDGIFTVDDSYKLVTIDAIKRDEAAALRWVNG